MLQPSQGPQGFLEFRNLTPGRYLLNASVRNEANIAKNFSSRTAVDIGAENIDNLTITVGRPIEVPGSLRVEGSANVDLSSARITLTPAENFGITFGVAPAAAIREDGQFTLQDVSPDRYMIRVDGMPRGFYLRSIQLGNEDGLEHPIDLTRGTNSTLRIVLAANAGQLTGAVTNENGQPVFGATVVLIPDSEIRRQNPQFYRTAAADQSGRYTLYDIDPGSYRLYAWDDVEPNGWLDPDTVDPVRTKGKPVQIREGSQESIDLKAI